MIASDVNAETAMTGNGAASPSVPSWSRVQRLLTPLSLSLSLSLTSTLITVTTAAALLHTPRASPQTQVQWRLLYFRRKPIYLFLFSNILSTSASLSFY